jgi:predicted nicotinamide N-methyase
LYDYTTNNTPDNGPQGNNKNEKYYTNPYIDVLQKNAAGRSSLTEAFALTSAITSSSSSNQPDKDESDDTKRDHDILTLLLEHPSANEERLIQSSSSTTSNHPNTNNTTNEEPNNDATMDLPPCHTHHFRFVGGGSDYSNSHDGNLENRDRNDEGIELYIREMAMAPPTTCVDSNTNSDNMATISKTDNNDLIQILGGTEPINDTTGYGIWSASIIMGQWMTDVFRNRHTNTNQDTKPIRTIVELGAGCGIPGITIAKSFLSRSESSILPTIYLTDLNPVTIRNLQHNVMTNQVESITSVVALDWNDLIQSDNNNKKWPWMMPSKTTELSETEEKEQQTALTSGIDILIGSDLVYQKEVIPILLQTIQKLRPQTFYYGAAGTNRDGHDLFIQSLQDKGLGGMTLVSSFPAPYVYRATNPLYNQDDDECFIHFQDLLLLSTNSGNNDKYDSGNGENSFTLYHFSSIKN